ncbi:MAG: RNA ligase family protein [Chloroflexota bacterium]
MYIKYPRTPHLPWSPGATADDVRIINTSHFNGLRVVVTEKLDGENTSMYRDHIHARSIDSLHHPSRNRVKQLHATIAHEIPVGWRLCGENVYARHSIAYEALVGYFYLFSIWNERNECLSWDETVEWSTLLGLPTPLVIFEGVWDEAQIAGIQVDEARVEGYVVRLADGFRHDDFSSSVAKWVRPNHVQTDVHWMHQPIVPNRLAAVDR